MNSAASYHGESNPQCRLPKQRIRDWVWNQRGWPHHDENRYFSAKNSVYNRKRKIKFIPVQLHLCEVPNVPCTWSLQRYMPILYLDQGQLHRSRHFYAWAGNSHRGQGKVHANTCCCIYHFVYRMAIQKCLLSILGLIFPSWKHILSWLRTSRA